MVNISEKDKTTQKNGRWLLLIWAFCIVLAFIRGRIVGSAGFDLVYELAQAMGGGTFIYLLPFVFLLIPTKLFKLFQYKSKIHLIVLTILCILLWGLSIQGALYNLRNTSAISSSNSEGETSVKKSHSSSDYIFGGDEYTVVFPSKPEIKEITASFGGTSYEGTQAELQLSSGGILRAEYSKIPASDAMLMDKEYTYEAMRKYAEYSGFERTEMTFTQDNSHKLCYLRGYKTFTNSAGTKKNAIYEVKNYIGRDSLFLVFAGGASEGYPQSGIVEFFNSVIIK